MTLDIVSMLMVARLGVEELDSAGLARVLANCSGVGVRACVGASVAACLRFRVYWCPPMRVSVSLRTALSYLLA